MGLPYDVARCAGTTHQLCQWCRRREPGCDFGQWYTMPEIDMMTGQCPSFIEPQKQWASDSTVPNA